MNNLSIVISSGNKYFIELNICSDCVLCELGCNIRFVHFGFVFNPKLLNNEASLLKNTDCERCEI